jgi:hypothetical protein
VRAWTMANSFNHGSLFLQAYEISGTAQDCKHEKAAAGVDADTQPFNQLEVPIYNRAPSSKKKHTYVWQCVCLHLFSLIHQIY